MKAEVVLGANQMNTLVVTRKSRLNIRSLIIVHQYGRGVMEIVDQVILWEVEEFTLTHQK